MNKLNKPKSLRKCTSGSKCTSSKISKKCPNGMVEFNSKCYLIYKKPVKRSTAIELSTKQNSSLLILNQDSLIKFLEEFLPDNNLKGKYWVLFII